MTTFTSENFDLPSGINQIPEEERLRLIEKALEGQEGRPKLAEAMANHLIYALLPKDKQVELTELFGQDFKFFKAFNLYSKFKNKKLPSSAVKKYKSYFKILETRGLVR